jgi:proteic killer suppression protein
MTEAIFNGERGRTVRRVDPRVLGRVQEALDALDNAVILTDLARPLSRRLHELTGDRAGQHSISVNMQYRLCFRWTDSGPEDVELIDYH